MFTDSRKHLPFPEAIDRDDVPDRFDISVGQISHTDLAHGIMVVDGRGVCECGQDHARATRLHEMGHVAWTPSDWVKRTERAKDAPPLLLVNAAEDARLTRLRIANGLEASPPILCAWKGEHQTTLNNTVKSGNLLALAGTFAAAVGSVDAAGFGEALYPLLEEMNEKGYDEEAKVVRRIWDKTMSLASTHLYSKSKPSFRSALSFARDLAAMVADEQEAYQEAKEAKEGAKHTVVRKVRESAKGPKDTWGTMEIVEVPLTKHSSLGMERKWTARDEGPIPTRFDRWSIDKRVFRARKRVKGAAVLVDCSSSMRWDEDDLRRVLEEVPAATVAIYSGKGSSGKLVIVARKGRRAKWSVVKPHKMGGNVVDGPALAWLAEQPQTVKIWMSDGGVTGPNDRHANVEHMRRMSHDVGRYIRRGGIKRVRDVEAVMRILSGKERFTPDRKFENPWGV